MAKKEPTYNESDLLYDLRKFFHKYNHNSHNIHKPISSICLSLDEQHIGGESRTIITKRIIRRK